MAKKVRVRKWQPKSLWTARRLAEISAEVEPLRKKVRVAEAAVSKSPAKARKIPSITPPQMGKQPRL
jgi:hypothetical protein